MKLLNNSNGKLAQEKSYAEYCELYDDFSNSKSNLPIFKLAILRNCTIEPLIPLLKIEIFEAGYYPEIYISQYDGIAADALNPNSELFNFGPDLIFVFQWLQVASKKISSTFFQHNEKELEDEVARIIKFNFDVNNEIRRNSGAPIISTNFCDTGYHTLGILDAQSEKWQANTISKLNHDIHTNLNMINDSYILDVNKIFNKFGSENIVSDRDWHISKMPLSRMGLVKIAFEFGKFIKAITGKQKKCLVLDCDNTLWGGILGEDGLEGIKCDQNYPGSCYLSLQEEILNLYSRGIIITLCSKNNEEDVMEALDKHPGIILRKEHLATWRINWDSKAENIKSIASELNIGLDSIVFVDDSEFEIGLVMNTIPEVSLISLSKKNPSEYRKALLEAGYFDSLAFTNEDKNKNQAYSDNQKRDMIRNQALTHREYLESLKIEISISSATTEDYGRCAQLTQKTNQFNLTTNRYTISKLEEILDKGGAIYKIQAQDCISDLGIIGLAVIIYDGERAIIDTFLMSCRALGRGIEQALLAHVVESEFSKTHVKRIIGKYFKTPKNSQVADFYINANFSTENNHFNENGSHFSLLASDKRPIKPEWIKIK